MIVRPPADEDRLDELRQAVRMLRREGHRVRVRVTFEGGDARRFALRAARSGSDIVVAAGGDGTISEVVNGLVASDATPRLAVVPFGTANDFARALELPDGVEESLRLAVAGMPVPLDVATVNGRCFVNVSTGGFGAAASQSAGRTAKKRLGALAYALSGAQKLVQYEPSAADFVADGTLMHSGPFAFYAVGNACCTGGGNWITPEADPGDGRLDVVIATGESRLEFLALLPAIRAGTHLDDEHVRYFRASRLEVATNEHLAVNADGEAVTGQRFSYGLLPRRLKLLVPAT